LDGHLHDRAGHAAGDGNEIGRDLCVVGALLTRGEREIASDAAQHHGEDDAKDGEGTS
jgi:hypothetical protein